MAGNRSVGGGLPNPCVPPPPAGHEQPCRVKLKLWCIEGGVLGCSLDTPRLTISNAVLCSEMGVHFSPCGRYLAACVASEVDAAL
jgi:activating molecule in BECN1-regulated autophagy protein 1